VTRCTRRLLLGVIAMLVPALAGCEAGLNAPTLQYHPAAPGTYTTTDGITIDDAFVLGPALNSTLPAGGRAGFFLSLYAQNADRLVSVSAPGTAMSVKLTSGPITLTPGTLVDLGGPTPHLVLTGLTAPLAGGQTIQMVLNFATAGSVPLQVPVEPAAYDYATYSPPAVSTPAPRATPTAKATPKAKSPASPSPSARASGSPSATP
jgi:copper(I)-binding protein